MEVQPHASVQQADPNASVQQAEGEEVEESRKPSGIQRLKQQRDEFRLIAQNQAEQLESLTSKVQVLESSQQAQTDVDNATSWDDLPVKKLHQMATDRNTIDREPQMANQALAVANTKQIQEAVATSRQELREEILQEVREETYNRDQLKQIHVDFGPDALNQESELWQEADAIYRASYEPSVPKDSQTGKKPVPPHLVRASFAEARHRINQRQPAQETPKGISGVGASSGPPPTQRVEGVSQGMADLLAESKTQLDSGDWKGALKTRVAGSLYPQV